MVKVILILVIWLIAILIASFFAAKSIEEYEKEYHG